MQSVPVVGGHICLVMQRIHEFDSTLRDAFLSGAHERGVYFIRRDITDRLMPCSPDKLMFSKLTSVRPGRRMLPIGLQTVAMSVGKKNLDQVDQVIKALVGSQDGHGPIPLETPVKLLKQHARIWSSIRSTRTTAVLTLPRSDTFPSRRRIRNIRGKFFLVAASNRDVARMRAEGRPSNAPDTKQQADFADDKAKGVPVLMMMRSEAKGWRGLPFWWSVIVVPRNAVTSVFAGEAPAEDVGTIREHVDVGPTIVPAPNGVQ